MQRITDYETRPQGTLFHALSVRGLTPPALLKTHSNLRVCAETTVEILELG